MQICNNEDYVYASHLYKLVRYIIIISLPLYYYDREFTHSLMGTAGINLDEYII